jgi:hypothetical protein
MGLLLSYISHANSETLVRLRGIFGAAFSTSILPVPVGPFDSDQWERVSAQLRAMGFDGDIVGRAGSPTSPVLSSSDAVAAIKATDMWKRLLSDFQWTKPR